MFHSVGFSESVCHMASRGFAVQTWLNGSRSCFVMETFVLEIGADPSMERGGDGDSMFPIPN